LVAGKARVGLTTPCNPKGLRSLSLRDPAFEYDRNAASGQKDNF
jgi:hypothetical protein